MPRRRPTQTVAYPRDPATTDRIVVAADRTARRHGLADSARRWAPYKVRPDDSVGVTPAQPAGALPVLALDDYSELPFIRTIVGIDWYEYRARLRCGEGDRFAVMAPPIEGYEEYNRQYLGLGRATAVQVRRGSDGDLQLARALAADDAALRELGSLARERGGLLLHPYMGIEGVWELAETIGRVVDVPVRVLGPLPEATRLANNKAEFSAIVEQILGPEAIAQTTTAADPAALAELLRDEVHRSDAVALKMPSCASGMGNRVFDSAPLRGRPLYVFREQVDRFLEDKEWAGHEEVLVVEWHVDVLESPSAQCWIPPLGAGEPVIEEVYQQFLLGTSRVFEGAMLSNLPRRLRHDLMAKSWSICRVFQRLGYVGRCSFDALVVGPTREEAQIKLVECNGRWGGTSTPMHLMRRVFGDFRSLPYKAQDFVDDRLKGMRFPDLVELFGADLYDRRAGRGRVLLYNVGGLEEHGKFDLVVTGRTFADVDRYLRERVPALIARYLPRGGQLSW